VAENIPDGPKRNSAVSAETALTALLTECPKKQATRVTRTPQLATPYDIPTGNDALRPGQ